MADFFKDSNGNLILLKSSISANGDTIFEADDDTQYITAEVWMDHLFEEIANSGLYVTEAYDAMTTRYMNKYNEYIMESPSSENIDSIVEYMNELREDALKNFDEDDVYYRDEPFTRFDVAGYV